jgi:hypothetical protein
LEAGLTPRALALALLFSVASVLWVREVELVRLRCQVTESVPPIPAVATLLALVAWAVWRARRPVRDPRRRRLGQPEILTVFAWVSIASVMSSVGVVRMLLPTLTVPRYFAAPDNSFARMASNLPSWYAPSDPETVRQFFESSDREMREPSSADLPVVGPAIRYAHSLVSATTLVPWSEWAVPLGVWMLFLTAYFVGAYCLLAILRRHWSESERLTFPLVDIAIRLSAPGGGAAAPSILRDRWLWIGFSVATLHNVLNMLKAFWPEVPALGVMYPLGDRIFTEQPWDVLRGVSVWFRPEMLGLGYFVPLDILGSTVLFWGVTQVEAVAGRATGYDVVGAPFGAEQAMGSFLVLGLVLLWSARRAIVDAVRSVWRLSGGAMTALGVVASAVVMVGIVRLAGMVTGHAVLYFALGLLVMVVHARVRAETGMPNVWMFPYHEQRRVMLDFAGTEAFRGGRDYQSATIFAQLFFLSRGYPVSPAATELESVELAERVGIRREHMTRAILLAVPVGLALAFWMHLSTYYELGANVLEGGVHEGGFRTYLARSEYQALSDAMATPLGPDHPKMTATVAGAGVTLVLALLRRALPRFPIHPLGFAIPNTLGYAIWAPLGAAWAAKAAILHLGGVGAYRKLAPAFVGLALGHYFAAGILWGVIAVIGGESTEGYQVWFG